MKARDSWYLIRTKPGKECWVRDQLSSEVQEVFLPMLKARTIRRGIGIAPLFPCYMFAEFDVTTMYYRVRYLPGVSGIVSAGTDPLNVPEAIIAELKSRMREGVIEIREKPLDKGERVMIVDGPFRGFEAVFDHYLSGRERVAILLGAVQSATFRMVVPAHTLARSC